MPANTSPVFPLTPKTSGVALSTTPVGLTGTNATALVTGGTNGTRVDRITAIKSGTTVKNILRLFLAPADGTKYLIREYPMAATTNDTEDDDSVSLLVVDSLDLVLAPTDKLYVGTSVSIGTGTNAMLHVTCEAGDF